MSKVEGKHRESWEGLAWKKHPLMVVEKSDGLAGTTRPGAVPTRTMESAPWYRLAKVPERDKENI